MGLLEKLNQFKEQVLQFKNKSLNNVHEVYEAFKNAPKADLIKGVAAMVGGSILAGVGAKMAYDDFTGTNTNNKGQAQPNTNDQNTKPETKQSKVKGFIGGVIAAAGAGLAAYGVKTVYDAYTQGKATNEQNMQDLNNIQKERQNGHVFIPNTSRISIDPNVPATPKYEPEGNRLGHNINGTNQQPNFTQPDKIEEFINKAPSIIQGLLGFNQSQRG